MTLILSCLTRDLAIQVSDRRLTWATGPHAGSIADDEQNKAVVWCNLVVFAYTGRGDVGGESTDDWLLEVASTRNWSTTQELFLELARRATLEIRTPHVFSGITWVELRSTPGVRPAVLVVSNTLDADLEWLPAPEREFRLGLLPLDDGESLKFWSAGRPLHPELANEAHRILRKCAKKRVGLMPYLRVLAQTIWAAAEHDESVGKSLMAAWLPNPRIAPASGMTVSLSGAHSADSLGCAYINPNRREPVTYAPHYTCGGLVFKGITAGYGSRPKSFPPRAK